MTMMIRSMMIMLILSSVSSLILSDDNMVNATSVTRRGERIEDVNQTKFNLLELNDSSKRMINRKTKLSRRYLSDKEQRQQSDESGSISSCYKYTCNSPSTIVNKYVVCKDNKQQICTRFPLFLTASSSNRCGPCPTRAPTISPTLSPTTLLPSLSPTTTPPTSPPTTPPSTSPSTLPTASPTSTVPTRLPTAAPTCTYITGTLGCALNVFTQVTSPSPVANIYTDCASVSLGSGGLQPTLQAIIVATKTSININTCQSQTSSDTVLYLFDNTITSSCPKLLAYSDNATNGSPTGCSIISYNSAQVGKTYYIYYQAKTPGLVYTTLTF